MQIFSLSLVRQAVAAEAERFILWLPVWLGFGIALYFALPFEPKILPAALLGFLSILPWVLFRLHPLRHLFTILLLIALGFNVSLWRARAVEAPAIPFTMKPVWVHGTVDKLEHVGKGYRLWLSEVDIWRFDPERTPARIRITVRTPIAEGLQAGERVSVKAGLSPPPGPVLPGGYDYSKVAYFERIGAVGYAVTPVKRLKETQPGFSFDARIQHLRQRMTEKIYAALQDRPSEINDRGSVAASMITGERGAISKPAMEALRVSGLAHILSISGLHLVLVTGTCFFLVRLLLASVPSIALRYPIKKWAAFLSLLFGFVYLLIADSPVPAVRSFIMVAFFLVAILVDRTGTPVRPVAFAATFILLLEPETLLSASFQMSFAAALALVATYESIPWLKPDRLSRRSVMSRIMLYVAGIILSSLVAGAATAPFGMYHFGRYSVYGLLSNLGALPVTSFLVMPSAMIGSLLMPFGLEKIGLVPMGIGVDLILKVSYAVSELPQASIPVHSGNLPALLLTILGGLWLCLWRSWIRFLGIPVLLLGFVLMPFMHLPDIYLDRGGSLFALRAGDGSLVFSDRSKARFSRRAWQEANAEEGRARVLRELENGREDSEGVGIYCTDAYCSYTKQGKTILILQKETPEPPCEKADVLVLLAGQDTCVSHPKRITRVHLAASGTQLWWFGASAIKTITVEDWRGNRLWTRRR